MKILVRPLRDTDIEELIDKAADDRHIHADNSKNYGDSGQNARFYHGRSFTNHLISSFVAIHTYI